jgi:hypothetical protein
VNRFQIATRQRRDAGGHSQRGTKLVLTEQPPLRLPPPIAKMSDIDDDMDVDAPPSKDMTFTADGAGKGKRSAANLPVEAEDSLPWCAFPYNHPPASNR